MSSSPVVEWWVELDGYRQDLEDVAKSFQLNSTCCVDRDTDGKCYLKSDQLHSLTDGNEVLARAEELVARINGAMKAQFSDYQPIHKTCGMLTLHANGKRGVVIVPEPAVMKLRAGRATVKISGEETSQPGPSEAERWLDLSGSDDDVADVLTYLSREPNWFDLYKLFEVIQSAMEGRDKVSSGLSEEENDHVALRDKVDRFARTANTVRDIRHARPNNDPPENPMDLREANQFVRDLTGRYLKWRLKQDA